MVAPFARLDLPAPRGTDTRRHSRKKGGRKIRTHEEGETGRRDAVWTHGTVRFWTETYTRNRGHAERDQRLHLLHGRTEQVRPLENSPVQNEDEEHRLRPTRPHSGR